jgi:hypothetical protein
MRGPIVDYLIFTSFSNLDLTTISTTFPPSYSTLPSMQNLRSTKFWRTINTTHACTPQNTPGFTRFSILTTVFPISPSTDSSRSINLTHYPVSKMSRALMTTGPILCKNSRPTAVKLVASDNSHSQMVVQQWPKATTENHTQVDGTNDSNSKSNGKNTSSPITTKPFRSPSKSFGFDGSNDALPGSGPSHDVRDPTGAYARGKFRFSYYVLFQPFLKRIVPQLNDRPLLLHDSSSPIVDCFLSILTFALSGVYSPSLSSHQVFPSSVLFQQQFFCDSKYLKNKW